MSGRYLSRNETAAQRARKHNLWIRYKDAWYTPDEFEQRYGHMRNSPTGNISLLNPLKELIYGRTLITQMVMLGKSGSVLIDALERLYRFEDKLLANFYEPVPNQPDRMSWPTDADPVHKAAERHADGAAGDIVVNEWSD